MFPRGQYIGSVLHIYRFQAVIWSFLFFCVIGDVVAISPPTTEDLLYGGERWINYGSESGLDWPDYTPLTCHNWKGQTTGRYMTFLERTSDGAFLWVYTSSPHNTPLQSDTRTWTDGMAISDPWSTDNPATLADGIVIAGEPDSSSTNVVSAALDGTWENVITNALEMSNRLLQMAISMQTISSNVAQESTLSNLISIMYLDAVVTNQTKFLNDMLRTSTGMSAFLDGYGDPWLGKMYYKFHDLVQFDSGRLLVDPGPMDWSGYPGGEGWEGGSNSWEETVDVLTNMYKMFQNYGQWFTSQQGTNMFMQANGKSAFMNESGHSLLAEDDYTSVFTENGKSVFKDGIGRGLFKDHLGCSDFSSSTLQSVFKRMNQDDSVFRWGQYERAFYEDSSGAHVQVDSDGNSVFKDVNGGVFNDSQNMSVFQDDRLLSPMIDNNRVSAFVTGDGVKSVFKWSGSGEGWQVDDESHFADKDSMSVFVDKYGRSVFKTADGSSWFDTLAVAIGTNDDTATNAVAMEWTNDVNTVTNEELPEVAYAFEAHTNGLFGVASNITGMAYDLTNEYGRVGSLIESNRAAIYSLTNFFSVSARWNEERDLVVPLDLQVRMQQSGAPAWLTSFFDYRDNPIFHVDETTQGWVNKFCGCIIFLCWIFAIKSAVESMTEGNG